MDDKKVTQITELERQHSDHAKTEYEMPTRSVIHPVLQLQRMIGNRAMDRLIQAKLAVNQPGDVYEQEAERVAEQVMGMPASTSAEAAHQSETKDQLRPQQSKEPGVATAAQLSAVPPIVHSVLNSGSGQSLDAATRAFMEPRFGQDLSQVRVHSDERAAESARAVNARAYTVGKDVVFGAGQYTPETSEGRRLLAHELTHVVQQHVETTQGKENEHPFTANSVTGEIGQQGMAVPSIQRVVELRPPGRGEQSAFGRVGELIDRLNRQSGAIQYKLDVDGRTLKYDIKDAATLTHFDRQMQAFIDRGEVVPMRLVTKSGLLEGNPILVDAFVGAYVDLDDLLASDDLSFQLNLIHLLTERFHVRNYARRVGTAFSLAEFNRAHEAGLGAETALLQDVVGDPTIKFNYEEARPNGTVVFAFRSDEGYRIFHVFRGAGRLEQHGEIFVQTPDGRRLTVEELIKERAAAAAPAPAP